MGFLKKYYKGMENIERSYNVFYPPLWLKLIVTILCLTAFIIHTIFPNVIDSISVSLIVLILFTWIIPLIKKAQVDKYSIEFKDQIEQKDESLSDEQLLLDGHVVKILKTLWKYQREHYPDLKNPMRWGFKVPLHSYEYSGYYKGLVILLSKKYVTTTNDEHCILTEEGISFCNKHSKDLLVKNPSDIYRF